MVGVSPAKNIQKKFTRPARPNVLVFNQMYIVVLRKCSYDLQILQNTIECGSPHINGGDCQSMIIVLDLEGMLALSHSPIKVAYRFIFNAE